MDFNKDDILATALGNEVRADRILSTAFDCTWTVIAETLAAIQAAQPVVESKGTDEDVTLHLMCVNALSDLIGALMSVRQGFMRPPAVILRAAIENLAGVVTFRHDADLMAQYLEGKYLIQKAVHPAKKYFPPLGTLYGEFSQLFAHETHDSVGRCIVKLESGAVALTLVPHVRKPEHCGVSHKLLLRLAQIAHIAGQITEWCFYPRLIQDSHYWRQDNNRLVAKTTGSDDSIAKLIATLKENSKLYTFPPTI